MNHADVDITASVVRVLVDGDVAQTAGTGFVITGDGLVATCAHVVKAAGSGPQRQVDIEFLACREVVTAEVEGAFWYESDDVAILRIGTQLPAAVHPLKLQRAAGRAGTQFRSYGFPRGHEQDGLFGYGKIGDLRSTPPRLQLRDAKEPTKGFSGAPLVVDGRAVGMIAEISVRDQFGRMSETAFAVPTETLRAICPALRVSDECPFRGLDFFDIDDARYYFGRRSEVADLVMAVSTPGNRCVAVFGPSGSGKSSLVRAGLLHALREGAVRGSREWAIEVTRPAAAPGSLHDLLKPTHTVLVIDQFEELFARDDDTIERWRVDMTSLLEADERDVSMVIVMRDDFYSQFAEKLPGVMRRWVTPNLQNIPAELSPADLEEIVVEPSRAAGLDVDPELVELITNEAIAASASGRIRSTVLPLVEFSLTWLWQLQDDGVLRADTFRRIGGIAGGVSKWAEQTYQSLSDSQQATARRIITRLTRLGDESRGLPDRRHRRTLDELAIAGSPPEVQAVVDVLARARLIVTSLDEPSGQQSVELIHDVLLREWRRLRDWLVEDREFLGWRDQLEQRVSSWSREGDPEDQDWLKGRELAHAEEWIALRRDEIPDHLQEFITLSTEARQRSIDRENELVETAEREREEAERQRQIATTRQVIQRLRTDADQAVALVRLDPARALASAIAAVGDSLSELGVEPLDAVQEALIVTDREARERIVVATGHHQVSDLTFAGTNSRIVTVGTDGRLRTWSAVTGQPDRPTFDHDEELMCVEVDGAGDLLVVGDGAGVVRAWRGESSEPNQTMAVGDDAVLAVSVGAGGETIVAGCADGTIARWAGTAQPDRLGLRSYVAAVAVAPDGRTALIGTGDGAVGVWPVGERTLTSIDRHDDAIIDLDISPDGELLAVVSADGKIRITHVMSGDLIASFRGSLSLITSLAFSADGSALVAGAEDGEIRMWDPLGMQIRPSLMVGPAIRAVSVSTDCRYVAAAAGGTVRVFDWLPRRPATAAFPPAARRWDPNGDQVAPAFQTSRRGGWSPASPAAADPAVLAVSFTRDGSIVSAGVDQSIRIWDPDGSERVCIPNAHDGGITAIAISPLGPELIASGGRDDVVRLHTTSGDAVGHPFEGHANDVMAIDFHRDGERLASGGRDGQVRIWNLAGSTLRTYDGHSAEVLAVRFSPDGEHIASAGLDGAIHVWTPGGSAEAIVVAHVDGRVWDVAFGDRGHLVAVADAGTVVVVDRALSRDPRPTVLVGHTGEVRAVRWHPNGRTFLTAATDGLLQTWDLEAGRLGRPIEGHVGPVYALDLSSDGRFMVTGGADGSVRLWQLGDWSSRLDDACDRLSRHPILTEPRSDLASRSRRACDSHARRAP